MGIRATVGGVALCLIALLAGCQSAGPQAQSPEEPLEVDANEPAAARDRSPGDESAAAAKSATDADLVLKFLPGRSVVYRVTTETEASVQWEGDASNKPAAFRGGAIGNRAEITFEQRVDRVDESGSATVAITILALNYLGRSRETVVLDFDSAREEDRGGPLSKLIGQSYELEMTPRGAVVSINALAAIRDSIEGASPEHQTALKLIGDREIRDRHEAPVLMALDSETVHAGGAWSNVTTLSFGRMGVKAYERLYTLERIETDDGGRIAHVTMKGIPSSAVARQLHEGQTETVPMGMFDNVDRYDGNVRFDLDAGQIDTYVEQFRTEWVAIDQEAVQSGADRPAAVRMTKTQLYRLERVER